MDVYLGNRTRENLTCGSEIERFGCEKCLGFGRSVSQPHLKNQKTTTKKLVVFLSAKYIHKINHLII